MVSNKDHLERLESEKNFHNERAMEESRLHQGKYYIAVTKARDLFSQLIARNSVNKDVLEIGCFHGDAAEDIAKNARSYAGIDISDVAIAKATELGEKKGLKNCNFYVRDACNTGFPDGSFDVVIACGIIHHLPIQKSLQEIKRILKRDGKTILFEPLGENPFINFYRKITPNARTPDETPLVKSDIQNIKNTFHEANIKYFGLTTLLCVPFRNQKTIYNLLYNFFYRLDNVLFMTPARWWAWMVVVEGKNSHV